MAFRKDRQFDPNACHVVGYIAFGVLHCWHDAFYDFTVELPLGAVYCRALTVSNRSVSASPDHMASGMLPDREDADFLDALGESMFERCVERHGPLQDAQCYGFVPALAISGAFGPMHHIEQIKRMTALEHFSILAQLDQFHLMAVTPTDIVSVRRIG